MIGFLLNSFTNCFVDFCSSSPAAIATLAAVVVAAPTAPHWLLLYLSCISTWRDKETSTDNLAQLPTETNRVWENQKGHSNLKWKPFFSSFIIDVADSASTISTCCHLELWSNPLETLTSHIVSSSNDQRFHAETLLNLCKQVDPNFASQITQRR